ncbi:pyridoxal phosphate-dependent decarboxylase family protein [Pelagimonas varians]|uniref:L-2,4-diaminobutyrate decarboxylase n=1 Tax=Pelagimonas varians TaxID=696760 RepID=A0A238L4C3_9RHOB|nr:aminotransferase class V-fold PLP-dependent enzyme [Pelagimonas varians]PYG26512.1 glutamate/tyrosine decarboxylase-like PLP-dependent enzyme [Pelagimonas varians]SMX49700.1 L-2,4-diaminobutyrate decarboxylase [Pelagimonas varians]
MTGSGNRHVARSEKLSLDENSQRAMEAAARHAIAYRATLDTAPAKPDLRPDAIAARFEGPLGETGEDALSVIEQIVQEATAGIHAHASPRFFGYVCGGSMPVGAAADFLVTAWGQNSASSWESPSIAAMEQAVCRWCLDLLGLDPECGAGIVTGATVANAQCIIAARDALLARQGWDIDELGLFGAPEIPILIGSDAHSAPLAGLRYAGLGLGRAIRLETDDQGRIQIDALQAALSRCENPPLVILQAGQINTGAFDPFAEAIPLIHERGGWVHVDGAFGLWAYAVPELKDRLSGVDGADSWAVDLHKWLNAPYDAGLSIVRDRSVLVAAMSARGAYLPDLGDTWEPSDSTLELSRRARGIPSYAILKHLGATGVREMIAHHCGLAQYLAEKLIEVPGIDVLNEVTLNQVAIACETDAITKQVLDRVQTNGQVYPSHGEWRGRQIIRVSITNYATSQADIDLLIQEILTAHRLVEGI